MATTTAALRRLVARQCRVSSSASVAQFSSAAPAQQRIVKLPPNLKIDVQSKCSPFAGAQRIYNDDEPDLPEEEQVGDDDSLEEDGYDEDVDDDDGEEFLFDLSSKPEPLRVIPLPDRLHITILDKSDLITPVGTLHLSPTVFGQDPIRTDLIQRVVQYQRNKKRGKRYAAYSKTIADVRGSGRKVRPQKGGGTARAGHRRPPHWRGGAKAHGPKGEIQDYTTKLNRHTKQLGMVHVLSQKLKEGNLVVVNDLFLESFKTKDFSKLLESVGISGRGGTSAYILDYVEEDNDAVEEGVYRNLPVHLTVAAGNLPHLKVSVQNYANVYDILKHEKLVVTLGAINGLEKRLGNVAD